MTLGKMTLGREKMSLSKMTAPLKDQLVKRGTKKMPAEAARVLELVQTVLIVTKSVEFLWIQRREEMCRL